MANNFFSQEEKKEEEIQENKQETQFKLGEKVYSQEELAGLVELGEIAQESEKKFNIKIDGMWPKFQQVINENVQFRNKQELLAKEQEEENLQRKTREGQELSVEEVRKQALLEAKSLGLVTREEQAEEMRRIIREEKAAERLLSETEQAITHAKEKWGIETTIDNVLNYMEKPENPKHPLKAIKDMYENQIDQWKEQQLQKVKQSGFSTIETSRAGNTPSVERDKVNDDNLRSVLGGFLRNRGQ